jgi:hypothetical protein
MTRGASQPIAFIFISFMAQYLQHGNRKERTMKRFLMITSGTVIGLGIAVAITSMNSIVWIVIFLMTRNLLENAM